MFDTLMFTTLIIIGVILALGIILWFLRRIEKRVGVSDELVEWLKSSTSAVDEKLTRNMEMFNTRLDRAATVIGNLQQHIGHMSEIGRSMKELQDFLNSPKIRGNIGEQVLKELLTQYLPKGMFSTQYTFKSGEKVDAVIKTSQGVLPIDSKFPMENFRRMHKETNVTEKKKLEKEFLRDVKKHIQDIAKKYILTSEGTVDYAMMYIPSESVYYEIISDQELCDFAGSKRVLPVSPTSFYAYIQAVLMAHEGQQIQSKAQEILTVLRAIKKDYEKTDESLSILNKHLTNAYAQLNLLTKNFLSIGQKLTSTNLLPSKKTDKEDQELFEETI